MPATPPADGASPDGRALRWVEHRERRRDELVREIRRIVHEHGPDLSMEEIATRLGTSKSILYRYFTDKTALQVAVGDYVLGRARGRLEDASRSSRDPRRAVKAMVETYLGIVQRSRNVFLFVNRPQQAASEGNLRSFVAQIEEMVEGILSPMVARDVPPGSVTYWAVGLVGLVRASAEEWVTSEPAGRPTLEELSADLTTLVWDGTHALISRRP
ncbi:MAG: TetR/AcrR family transcriptional regulator [bacterium]|nr:TetR/AcrR family transcriptional regulator [bacterium]